MLVIIISAMQTDSNLFRRKNTQELIELREAESMSGKIGQLESVQSVGVYHSDVFKKDTKNEIVKKQRAANSFYGNVHKKFQFSYSNVSTKIGGRNYQQFKEESLEGNEVHTPLSGEPDQENIFGRIVLKVEKIEDLEKGNSMQNLRFSQDLGKNENLKRIAEIKTKKEPNRGKLLVNLIQRQPSVDKRQIQEQES